MKNYKQGEIRSDERIDKRGAGSTSSGVKRPNYYCSHCKMSGHSLERCWKGHGYPPRYKQNTWRRSNTGGRILSANDAQTKADNETDASKSDEMIKADLTLGQYQRLMQLMKQENMDLEKIQETEPNMSTPFLAGTFCVLSHKFDGWIIDSAASDV